FWNCVWLFLNDAIFGYTFGVYVLYNRHYLAARIDEAIQLGFDSLVDPGLAWLDSWPVGLKLNAQLSGFFRLAFLQISVSFLAGVQLISRAGVLPLILSIIGILGCLSMSFLLAMCTDLFTLLTVNVSISYRLMAAVQRFQWSALYHLFTLFRGKRRNFLRRRIDSWEYEIDQLILGTVLFTLVVFLLPTVLVYYAFFTCLRVGMLSIQACIEVMLACMNYFPLFAILLRLKDPERLPGACMPRRSVMNED
ncbi:Gpi1-domain-containing protein, partial [Auriculariales sp. MPI-PUGE-AT-0066]